MSICLTTFISYSWWMHKYAKKYIVIYVDVLIISNLFLQAVSVAGGDDRRLELLCELCDPTSRRSLAFSSWSLNVKVCNHKLEYGMRCSVSLRLCTDVVGSECTRRKISPSWEWLATSFGVFSLIRKRKNTERRLIDGFDVWLIQFRFRYIQFGHQ